MKSIFCAYIGNVYIYKVYICFEDFGPGKASILGTDVKHEDGPGPKVISGFHIVWLFQGSKKNTVRYCLVLVWTLTPQKVTVQPPVLRFPLKIPTPCRGHCITNPNNALLLEKRTLKTTRTFVLFDPSKMGSLKTPVLKLHGKNIIPTYINWITTSSRCWNKTTNQPWVKWWTAHLVGFPNLCGPNLCFNT